MSFILVGAGIAAAGATYNVGSGIAKTNAGNRLAAGNVRPWYNIPSQYYQDDNLAASQAETGLSPSSLNFYTTNAARGLTTGTNTILDAGGDVDNLAKLYDQFSQGLAGESAEDQNLKSQHLNTFIGTNRELGGQQSQQWALNYYEPYKDTAQLASAEKGAGQQEIGTGIGEAVGAASAVSNANLYADRTNVMNTTNMGQQTGSEPINAGSTPTTGLTPFTTEGGQAVMGQMGKTDAWSSPLQQLIAAFQKQQSQPVN